MPSNAIRYENRPILVTAATGKTGRRVAAALSERGMPVRLGSRGATPAFDWNDRSTWDGALAGAGAVYIAYHPDLAVPGARATVAAFIERALAHGVTRQVLLSGRGEPEAQATERALMDSGADWTIVRAAWFMQNFSEGFMLDGIRAGELVLPASEVREPFVDADDIAEIVVCALAGEGHSNRLYEVTGPRLMTFPEAVAEIAAATGRPIRYVPVTVDAYADELRRLEVPADFVALIDDLFRNVLDGRNASLADGVRQALDRAPRDFATYARETARTGTWHAQSEPAGA